MKFPHNTNHSIYASHEQLSQNRRPLLFYLRMHSRWVKTPYSSHGGVQVADLLEL